MEMRQRVEKILLKRFDKKYPNLINILTLIAEGGRVCDIVTQFPNIKEQSIRNIKQRYKQELGGSFDDE